MTIPSTETIVFYGDDVYGAGYYMDGPSQRRETSAVNRALTPLPPPIFTGMKLQEDVIINDLVLNKIDENNVIWVCTDIDGWWVHPDPDIPDVTRGWRDGSYDARGRWQARQITLTGSFFPPAPEYVPAARDALVSALNLVYTGGWLKTRENPTKAAFVRLSGRPEIKTVAARGRTDFSVGLRAADPVRYSWNESDPDGYDSVEIPCENTATEETGLATITNDGNADVSIFIEVVGPIVGDASIVNVTTGEVLLITSALRDSLTRTVTSKQLLDNNAVLTVSSSFSTGELVVGDYITVTGVDATFNGTHLVTGVPSGTQVQYSVTAGNVAPTGSSGSMTRSADVLEIDTYEREVAYNGETLGARVMIDTLTDWLVLAPGDNDIQFTDEGAENSTASMTVYYRSGWIG